jgi:hypothetical protein
MVRAPGADATVIEATDADATVFTSAAPGASINVQTVDNGWEADLTVRTVSTAAEADLTVSYIGGGTVYTPLTTTAGTVDNGGAPVLEFIGFGGGVFEPVPDPDPDPAGWTREPLSLSDAAIWSFDVDSPADGARLVGWGLEATTVVDVAPEDSGGLYVILSDGTGEAMPPGDTAVTGDMTDLADVPGPPGAVGGYLPWSNGETVSGTCETTLTTPVEDPVGYHLEFGTGTASNPTDTNFDIGRVYLLWEVPDA